MMSYLIINFNSNITGCRTSADFVDLTGLEERI